MDSGIDYVTECCHDFERASFEDWDAALDLVYGRRNERRSVPEMWLRAVSDASKVGEAVRKNEYYEAMFEIAHTFGWILTTYRKLAHQRYGDEVALQSHEHRSFASLTETVLAKYPGICGYCGLAQCTCNSMRRKLERQSKEERHRWRTTVRLQEYSAASLSGRLPQTIAGVSDMFGAIYDEVHYDLSLERITFHFLEEIGEVASCITNMEDGSLLGENAVPLPIQLGEEMADVIGWGIAVTRKLGDLAERSSKLREVLLPNHTSQDHVNERYDRTLIPKWLWHVFAAPPGIIRCHTCHSNPCQC